MRLVTFGCSMTLGDALPDRWDYEKKKPDCNKGPSKYAWPQLLADKLNIECVNAGFSGASNKKIWWDALNFDYQNTDIVIILWSFLSRSCIITGPNIRDHITFGTWSDNDPGVSFYKHWYREYDMLVDFYLRCNHLHNFLIDKVKTIYYAKSSNSSLIKIGTDAEEQTFVPIKDAIKFNKITFLKSSLWHIREEIKSLALDNAHPGIEANEQFATEVYNEIKNEIT